MRKLTLLLTSLFLIGIGMVNAQTKRVTGNVTSAEDKQPIPGVQIQVKGTSLGTISDLDGNYAVQVPDDATALVFSFVGMNTTEVEITGSVVDFAMESSFENIDEVVVTALGISREKKSLGYATQGVDADELLAAQNSNPIQGLSGKVAGLTVSGQNFGGSQNVMIRGISSFSESNQPLYVIDGVPMSNENFNTNEAQRGGGGYDYGGMINDINSYDIENIEVLKGSAASALYGSRGQNGVIMITTKTGKAGRKSFSVDINSGVTFEQVSILPKMQNSYGGGYGDFDVVEIGGQTYQAVSYAIDESWGPKFEGQQVLHWWGAADYEQGITDTPQTGAWEASQNDVDQFYETGIAYTNSVNIVTTSESSALRIGYTNVNMTGTVPNSFQNKNNFNVNGSSSLFEDFIEVNANVNFAHTYTKGRPEFGYGDNSQSQKFFQWGQRQLDMERLKNYKNPDGTNRTWNRTSWDDPTPKYSDNPYWTAYENYQDDDRTRVYGTAGLKINITDYLNATGNIYLDTYTFNNRERVAKGSQALSSYKQFNRQATEINYEGKLNFNKTVEDFSILAMLGANKRAEQYQRFQGESVGGLVIDGLYNLNNSNDPASLDDFKRFKQVNSWFTSASVGWKNMIYVDGTYRMDYDTSLPNGANSYGYYSVSGSFIASELIKAEWLNILKIRANYGVTGNGTSPYKVYNVWTIGDPFGGNPTFSNSTSKNPDTGNSTTLNNTNLLPEFTYESEIGVEASFLQNRIGFDLSLYNRDTKNQIVPVEVSASTGFKKQYINAGLINNKGIEILLYGTPVKMRNFSWDISVNFAKNTNEVKDLPTPDIQHQVAPFGGAYVKSTVGMTAQTLYGYDYEYYNGEKVIGDDGFYVRGNEGSLTPMGSVLPDYTAGVRNSFRFLKNFDASALIDISKGGNYYSITNMWAMYSGMHESTATATSNGNTIREDGLVLQGVNVTKDEDGNITASKTNDINISAIDYGELHYHGYGTPSATSFFDASYVKLREVTLGYTLPKFTDIVQSLRVSLYGRNLAVWGLDNPGIDPETVVGGSGIVQGLEGGIIPSTRSYGLNVQIKF